MPLSLDTQTHDTRGISHRRHVYDCLCLQVMDTMATRCHGDGNLPETPYQPDEALSGSYTRARRFKDQFQVHQLWLPTPTLHRKGKPPLPTFLPLWMHECSVE
jgi:hypothetical protein